MTDLNFEELDKAIGAIIGADDEFDDKPKKHTKRHLAKDKVKAEAKVGEETAKPHESYDEAIHEEPSPRPFRGHFLDMVHPSSDALNPHKPNFAETKNEEVIEAKESKPIESELVEPEADQPVREFIAHDASSVMGNGRHSGNERRALTPEFRDRHILTQPKPREDSAVSEELAAEAAVDEAYESPFLPDATSKVEKRPLGSKPASYTNLVDEQSVNNMADAESTSAKPQTEPDDLLELAESDFIDDFIDDMKERRVHESNAVNKSVDTPMDSVPAAPAATTEPVTPTLTTADRQAQIAESRYAVEPVIQSNAQLASQIPAPARPKSHRLRWVLLFILVIAAGSIAGILYYLYAS